MIPPGYPAPARPPVVRPLWSLVGPALGALLAAGVFAAPVGPLGSTIGRDLGLSTTTVIVTLVVPFVVTAAALVAPGYLLGRRWPTAIGAPALVLLIIGSLMSSLAPGTVLFTAARAVVGLGAGAVVGVALALSGQVGRWRSQTRLVLGLALGAALLIGPVVSAMLTMTLSWRLVFLVDVLVAMVALVGTGAGGVAMWIMRASRPSPPAAPATAAPPTGETGSAAQRADSSPT